MTPIKKISTTKKIKSTTLPEESWSLQELDHSQTESFHVMAKPAGARCNLSCSYCFYRSKDFRHQSANNFMSEQVLEKYVSQVIASEPTDQATIAWQGGEPTLLGVEFYRKAANLASKYLPRGKRIQWTMQTNGTLLNDDWCDFFRQNGYLVGISLDGPQEVHDAYRKDSQGNGTFVEVIHAIELLKKHEVDFNVLCCVHSANGNMGLGVYRFLRDNVGSRYIQFIPVVEHAMGNRRLSQTCDLVTSRSVQPMQWGQFLIDVFDEWVHNDVGEVFVLIFDWALASWLGLESPACIFQRKCGRALVLEQNGDIYSCDHFVNQENLIGNIQTQPLVKILSSKKQSKFGARKENLPIYCEKCNFRFACNGECPKNRFTSTFTGEPGPNYLCAGYKRFFAHIDKSMQIMACLVSLGRPVEEIMNIRC